MTTKDAPLSAAQATGPLSAAQARPGPIALVGGDAWTDGCDFDTELLKHAGGEVLVVPTAAAYEHPHRSVEKAARWFESLGAKVRELPVLRRGDATDKTHVEAVASSRLIYLADGSPLHLRSVLKDSAVWDAIVSAWKSGAVLAGTGAGAMVFGDSMVDPRGGALTLGLGLLSGIAVLPHADTWSHEKTHRTVELATGHLRIVAVDERTALLRSPTGSWRAAGAGKVVVYLDGSPAGLESLPS